MGIQGIGLQALVSMNNNDVYFLSIEQANELAVLIESGQGKMLNAFDQKSKRDLMIQVAHVSSIVLMGGQDNG